MHPRNEIVRTVWALRARMLATEMGVHVGAELPDWANAVPVPLYKRWVRLWLQRGIVVWSVATFMWV